MIDSNRLIEALNNIARAIELNVETFQNIQKPDVTQDEDLPKPENLELNEVRRHLEATKYQLSKMTELVEDLVCKMLGLTSILTKYQIPKLTREDENE